MRRTEMICECGLRVPAGGHRHHQLSVYHRHHREIRSLLAKNSVTLVEIGERFGITRERVRQIARQLGTSGRQRKQQHVLDQRMSAWTKQKRYRELIAKCKKLRYTVTPIRKEVASGWRFEQRFVAINGWRVRVVYITPWGRYLIMRHSIRRADFYLGLSPIGTFIFPSKVWKTFPIRTTFSRTPCVSGQSGFTHSDRHDYLQYLEAWKLLRRRR